MAGWRDFCGTQAELAAWFLRKVAPAYWWGAAPGITIVFDDFGQARGRLAGYTEGAAGGYVIHVGDHLADDHGLDYVFYLMLHELAHVVLGHVQPSTDASATDDPEWRAVVPLLVIGLADGGLRAERAELEAAADAWAAEEYAAWDAAFL